MQCDVKYVQVLAPVRLEWEPWYSVDWDAEVGERVEIYLQKNRYIGVVTSKGGVPDIEPVKVQQAKQANGLTRISNLELSFWRFLSSYYMCTLGEIYKLAYPFVLTSSEQSSAKLIAKLEQRLAIKEANLSKKHTKAVLERLNSERVELLEQLSKARQTTVKSRPSNTPSQKAAKPVYIQRSYRLESYVAKIDECIAGGKGVLILEPEYDFTSLMHDNLESRYQDILISYNSKLTKKQRRESLARLTGSNYILVGTRLSVFLPFNNLGLVIVDSEHDPSYKQTDSNPRINYRDAAAYLASLHGAQLVLGSNSPTLESVYNCHTGKYTLKETQSAHYSDVMLVDIPSEKAKNGMVGLLSRKAIEQIEYNRNGIITIIRGWERPEEIMSQVREIDPELDPQILHAFSARKSVVKSNLMIILQADSLFSRTDFKADEKAFQMLRTLSERTDKLIIQSSNSKHPVYQAIESNSLKSLYDILLKERKDFNLPPYTRLVDVLLKDGSVFKRITLQKNKSLQNLKQSIYKEYSAQFVFDVDP